MVNYLANALKDIDCLLKVSDMKNWEFQFDVAEVAWANF
jgi:hypothetical protein